MAPSHPFPKGCYYALLLAACLVTMLGSLGFDDRTVLSYSPPFHQALNDMFGDSQAVSTVTSPPAQTAGLGGWHRHIHIPSRTPLRAAHRSPGITEESFLFDNSNLKASALPVRRASRGFRRETAKMALEQARTNEMLEQSIEAYEKANEKVWRIQKVLGQALKGVTSPRHS